MTRSDRTHNPFVFARPLGSEPIIDREAELETLLDRYHDGVNTRLASPRDYGKTSLLNRVCADVAGAGGGAVLVDLFGATTGDQMAAQIDRAFADLPGGKLRRAADSLGRRGGGFGLHTPLGGASASVGPEAGTNRLLIDSLSLPHRISQKSGVRMLVCFDEFQVVLKAGLDAVIRSVIQHHGDGVTYVFCGSHPGMMRELFSDRKRPFYGQAAPLELGRLGREPMADYIVARFEETDRDIGLALGPLLDLVEGHPQRAMLIAHLLWAELEPGEAAGPRQWQAAFQGAWPYLQEKYEAVWNEATRIEAGVLEAVASGVQALTGKRAREEFGLPRGSTAGEAASRLVDDGILVRGGDGRLSVDDPLLAVWIAAGRRWPA